MFIWYVYVSLMLIVQMICICIVFYATLKGVNSVNSNLSRKSSKFSVVQQSSIVTSSCSSSPSLLTMHVYVVSNFNTHLIHFERTWFYIEFWNIIQGFPFSFFESLDEHSIFVSHVSFLARVWWDTILHSIETLRILISTQNIFNI